MKKSYLSLCFLFIIVSVNLFFVSCTKEEEYATGGNVSLKFSQDTLTFDTIFTTVGSITKKVVVYNEENEAVKINWEQDKNLIIE